MSSLLALLPILLPPAPQEVRWFLLDPESNTEPLRALTEPEGRKIARELEIEIAAVEAEEGGRALGYAGEDRGLLSFLLGLTPAPSRAWLASPELNFRAVGLGTHVEGDRAVSRALLAPWAGGSWLLALGGAASLDEEKLRRHSKSPPARKSIAARLQNLLRDAHAARNASQPKPPRLGYPNLVPEGELEVGDAESEAFFSFRGAGTTRRAVHRAALPTGGTWIDDGIVAPAGGSLRFALELGSLISDDLLLVGRSADAGQGELLVDGVPLAGWRPSFREGVWGEAVLRIANRLLTGKEKAQFEIRPLEGESVSLYRLEVLRLPFPEAEYLSDRGLPEKPNVGADRSAAGTPLTIGGYRFLKGVGLRAPDRIEIRLRGDETRFEAYVGLDAAGPKDASAIFRVLVDGEEKFKTRRLAAGDEPFPVSVFFENAKILSLAVDPAEPGQAGALADWVEARAR